jgi:hypothetical protein
VAWASCTSLRSLDDLVEVNNELGRPAEALAELKVLLAHASTPTRVAEAHSAYAITLAELGQISEAVDEANEATAVYSSFGAHNFATELAGGVAEELLVHGADASAETFLRSAVSAQPRPATQAPPTSNAPSRSANASRATARSTRTSASLSRAPSSPPRAIARAPPTSRRTPPPTSMSP